MIAMATIICMISYITTTTRSHHDDGYKVQIGVVSINSRSLNYDIVTGYQDVMIVSIADVAEEEETKKKKRQ